MSSDQHKGRPAELVFAILISVFSVGALWQAYEISGFKSLSSAGVFPMLASGTMLVSALIILCRTAPGAIPGKRFTAELKLFFRDVLPLRHILMLGLILLYLVSMPWLGFITSSGLFLFVSFAYLWGKNILVSASVAIVSLLAIYFVFRVVFQVVLPQGEWLRGLI